MSARRRRARHHGLLLRRGGAVFPSAGRGGGRRRSRRREGGERRPEEEGRKRLRLRRSETCLACGWCVSSHCTARQCCTPPSPTRVIDWRLRHLHRRIRHVDHCLAGRGLARHHEVHGQEKQQPHAFCTQTRRPRQPRTRGFLQSHSLKKPNKSATCGRRLGLADSRKSSDRGAQPARFGM